MPKKVRFFLRRSSKVEISGRKPVIIPFNLFQVSFLFLMVLVSAFLFLRSDLFQIKKIEIKSPIPDCATEEGIKLTTEAVGASIIFYERERAEKQILEKFYCISTVMLRKIYPSTLEIIISERIPVAAGIQVDVEPTLAAATTSASIAKFFATPSALFALDKNGIIFKNLSTTSAFPKVYITSKLRLGEKVPQTETLWLLNFLTAAQNFNLNLTDFSKTVDGVLVGETQDGIKLVMSEKTDPVKIASSLQAILRQAKIEGAKFSILDLRFEKPTLK